MPIKKIDAATVLETMRNRLTIWPDGRSATERMKGIAKVACNPSFSISKDDRFFTMGSCFARSVERRLNELGFDVPLARIALDASDTSDDGAGTMAKYTIHSIVNELRWATEKPGIRSNSRGSEVAIKDLLIEDSGNKWFDPHFYGRADTLERIINRREKYETALRCFPQCSVFIFTLGLAETWYDNASDLYLNRMPPLQAIKKSPSRFHFEVLSYEDILEELENLRTLLHTHVKRNFKILISVSPVPFNRTFTNSDALVANTYSKAVQRAAAEVFYQRHDDVDYFPSYEIVTMTDRREAFEQDNIHVLPSTVDNIMDQVISSYSDTFQKPETVRNSGKQRPLQAKESVNMGRGFFHEGEYEKAAIAYAGALALFGEKMNGAQSKNAYIALALSLANAGRNEDAVKIAEKIEACCSLDTADASNLWKLWTKLGRPDDASRYKLLIKSSDKSVG